MLLRWSPDAADDFESIVEYLTNETPQFTSQTVQQIEMELTRLLVFPNVGRPGNRRGTRELVIAPYVVVYRVHADAVEVVRIFHGAQDWRR